MIDDADQNDLVKAVIDLFNEETSSYVISMPRLSIHLGCNIGYDARFMVVYWINWSASQDTVFSFN